MSYSDSPASPLPPCHLFVFVAICSDFLSFLEKYSYFFVIYFGPTWTHITEQLNGEKIMIGEYEISFALLISTV